MVADVHLRTFLKQHFALVLSEEITVNRVDFETDYVENSLDEVSLLGADDDRPAM